MGETGRRFWFDVYTQDIYRFLFCSDGRVTPAKVGRLVKNGSTLLREEITSENRHLGEFKLKLARQEWPTCYCFGHCICFGAAQRPSERVV